MRRLGDRPMTSSERQRRYLAKLARPAPAPQVPASSELVVKVDHLRRFPDQIAPWLCQRLGKSTMLAFHNALGRALADAPEEGQ
jgi:hypothetical protein